MIDDRAGNVPCPKCDNGALTTVATAPYARGYILAVERGTKKIAGCKKCVAHGLRVEAGKSLLFGWFSITALVLNIFFIPWNLFRSLIVREDDIAVSKFFDEVGVPRPGTEYRIADAFYSAGAAMIRADGKIEPSEVEAAKIIGQQMLDEYDPTALDRLLDNSKSTLPINAIATVFRVYLNNEGQTMVLRYLFGIALADGDFAKSEDKYLERLAVGIGFSKKDYRAFRDELFQAT